MSTNRIASSALTAALSLIRRWLSNKSSLWISPMSISLAIAVAISAGSMATWARAPQPAEGVPAGFDPSGTKSLAEFLAVLCAQSYGASFPAEAPFLAGNTLAMSKMMTGMAITPSGDIDTDFVHMMVPHHQGAIDMAVLEIRYGKNSILKRLAQEVIIDQQQEVTAMYLAIHEPLPASAAAPTWKDAPVLSSSFPARQNTQ